MIAQVLGTLREVFGEALDNIITVAVRGGGLFWLTFMGKILGAGFFQRPFYKKKVVFISMPIAVLVALFFAFWGYKWVVDPGETQADALHDAQLTFCYVLLPLWAGCIWGMVSHPDEKQETKNEPPADERVD